MKLSGVISEYDWHICNKLVDVMSGGDVVKGAPITEQYLLILKGSLYQPVRRREDPGAHRPHAKTGKPLRN